MNLLIEYLKLPISQLWKMTRGELEKTLKFMNLLDEHLWAPEIAY